MYNDYQQQFRPDRRQQQFRPGDNYRGLLYIFWALIAIFCSPFVSALISLGSMPGLFRSFGSAADTPWLRGGMFLFTGASQLVSIVTLAAMVFFIVGLVTMKDHSKFFGRALTFYIVGFAVSAVFVAIIVYTFLIGFMKTLISLSEGAGAAGDTVNTIMNAATPLLIVFSVYVAAINVLNYLMYRSLMTGCAECSWRNGDYEMEKRCMSAVRLKLAAMTAMIVTVVTVLVMRFINGVPVYYDSDSPAGFVIELLTASTVGVIGYIIAGVINTIAEVMILIRIWNVYAAYGKARRA